MNDNLNKYFSATVFPYKPPSKELLEKYSELATLDNIRLPVSKRLFDIIFSTIVLLFACPFILILYIMSKIEGLLDQTAIGPFIVHYEAVSGGKIIKKYKIRVVKEKYTNRREFPANDWRSHFGEWEDYKKTFFGKLAKDYYLDEIPQIYSILIGDMTWVGPRPLAVIHYDKDIGQGNYSRKLLRGGLLGLGHVKKGTNEFGSPEFEFEYASLINKNSGLDILLMDLRIIWEGLRLVMKGEGL